MSSQADRGCVTSPVNRTDNARIVAVYVQGGWQIISYYIVDYQHQFAREMITIWPPRQSHSQIVETIHSNEMVIEG